MTLPIRILLVAMPRMLHDVVASIIGIEADLRIVADCVEPGALLEQVERERPDVVVLCVESASSSEICEDVLRRFPELSVVALEDRGKRASIYMMRSMRFRIAEVSRTQLVTAIRQAAAPVPFPTSVYDASTHL